MMETDENDRIVVIAYQTVTCAASSVSNWVLPSRQLAFFYAFLSSFVASPVSVPNSSKIQNTAAVASLNNPPSNQNATSIASAPARQATFVESRVRKPESTTRVAPSAVCFPPSVLTADLGFLKHSPAYARKQTSAGIPNCVPN